MSAQAIESPDQKALARTLSAIDRLGLNENLIERDAQGYTTIRGVLSEDQIARANVVSCGCCVRHSAATPPPCA